MSTKAKNTIMTCSWDRPSAHCSMISRSLPRTSVGPLIRGASACLFALFYLPGFAMGDDAETIRMLQAENKMLRAQVESLTNEIAALKAQAPATRPATTQPAASGPTASPPAFGEGITYLGKLRSKVWLDTQYRLFADKIAVVDGRYYDIGRDVLMDAVVLKNPPEVGARRRGHGIIVQAMANGDALVQTGPLTEVLYFVRGIAPEANLKDAPFRKPLIYIGPHNYITAYGSEQTVQGYVVYQTLTPDQFRQALTSGLKLVAYVKTKDPNTIVARPVP